MNEYFNDDERIIGPMTGGLFYPGRVGYPYSRYYYPYNPYPYSPYSNYPYPYYPYYRRRYYY